MIGKKRTCRTDGFTLVELLVVLAILGMLAALVGPQVLNQLGVPNQNRPPFKFESLNRRWNFTNWMWVGFHVRATGYKRCAPASGAKGRNGPYLKKIKSPTIRGAIHTNTVYQDPLSKLSPSVPTVASVAPEKRRLQLTK